MNYTQEDQTTALAGMTLAAKLVRDIARSGKASKEEMLVLFGSITNISPLSTQDVYVPSPTTGLDISNSAYSIKNGYRTLIDMLKEPSNSENQEYFRYLLGMMTLEKKLRKRDDLMDILGKRIEHLSRQLEHFGVDHDTIISSIASIYQDTLSTLSTRLQIMGSPDHLKQTLNAEKIRALLMAGIRSASLFRQTGGKRWHLLLKQRSIVRSAEQNLNNLET